MCKLSIIFDENQIISESRQDILLERIGGNIYLKLDNYFFPFEIWYDYPVTIFTWWLENCVKLNSGSEELVKNYFMDGPYEFWVEKDDDSVEIKFLRRDPGEDEDDDDIYVEVSPSCKILFEDYKNELYQAGNKMLDIFDKKHVLGKEVQYLKSLVKSLK